ncbi:hypothetical protein VTN31DRAFT_3814 [Thermomyces dupontii]|uniref:uncharacterized protein n=1 Tax=Talaromyces thermophilus TaxID=28565 RepID=UPI003742F166
MPPRFPGELPPFSATPLRAPIPHAPHASTPVAAQQRPQPATTVTGPSMAGPAPLTSAAAAPVAPQQPPVAAPSRPYTQPAQSQSMSNTTAVANQSRPASMTPTATASVAPHQPPVPAPSLPYTQPVQSQSGSNTATIARAGPSNPGVTAAGQPSSTTQPQAGTTPAINAVHAKANTPQTTSTPRPTTVTQTPPSARSQLNQPSTAPSGRAGAQPTQNINTSASQRNGENAAQSSRGRGNRATSRRATQQPSATPGQATTQQNTAVTNRGNTNADATTAQYTPPDLTESEVTMLFKCCDELFRHYEQGRKFWMRVEARLSVRIGRVYPWWLCKKVVHTRVKKRLAEKAKFPSGYIERPLSRVNKAIDRWTEWLGWRAYEKNRWDPALLRREEIERQYERSEPPETASELMREILDHHRERGTKRSRDEVEDSDSDDSRPSPPPPNAQANTPNGHAPPTPAAQQRPARDGGAPAQPAARETQRAQERDKSVEIPDKDPSRRPISLGSNRTRADIDQWIEGVMCETGQPVHNDYHDVGGNGIDNSAGHGAAGADDDDDGPTTNNGQQPRESHREENRTGTDQPDNADRIVTKQEVMDLKAAVGEIRTTLNKMSEILIDVVKRMERNYPTSDQHVPEAVAS